MPEASLTSLEARYVAAHPRCRALAARAAALLPSAVTHDIRHLVPFPVYVDRAAGTRKWDVDGQEYVDGWMGHGALFLGHNHPEVVAAVAAQLEKGTHYGACHELEIEWAALVRELVPSAEKVRFTASGTEATHLAMRLARAFTGRPAIVKLEGHFHGWHDAAVAGVRPPYDRPISAGIPAGTLNHVLLCPPNDLAAMERLLATRRDVAGVILEPAGGASGTIPTQPGYLAGLRELTRQAGVVLIFDEVISGFRYAPGGAQAYFGVTPDLTTLAKILAGGLPGGAVAGRADILDTMAFTGDPEHDRLRRVAHAGTFNANPLSAAAGVATLRLIRDGRLHERANAAGARLRAGMAQAAARRGLARWVKVYGEASVFNWDLFVKGPDGEPAPAPESLYHLLRLGWLEGGCDVPPRHGWLSALHGEGEIERMVAAFDHALGTLAREGLLGD
ncbi:MAG TPA: aminotransferase class III-fold pyridoxal phosphate-dependent enzyme [Thermodesulfobacteriota bacterium]|nr:aminotransferase class III-fold pyridoxal phosphate-dependent enzyme [Thermodesulfobacteriota bacterium]